MLLHYVTSLMLLNTPASLIQPDHDGLQADLKVDLIGPVALMELLACYAAGAAA